MRQWVRIGWHLDGMSFERFLALTIYQRFALHEELHDLIQRTNDEGDGIRPKEWRK